MTVSHPIDRLGARVLLVDGTDRVLLFRGRDPARPGEPPYWFTVGGGLEGAETAQQAALREIFEETGLRQAAGDLAGPVWHEVSEFEFDGQVYRQTQDFFVCRVAAWEVDTSAFDEPESRSIDAHRWWSVAELEATDEVFYPEILSGLLRRVLTGAG